MNIFGVGFEEIALILILVLILVGPRRLPETAAQIGRTVRTMRRYAAVVTAQVKEEFADLEAEYEAMKGEADQASRGLREVSASVGQATGALAQDIERSTTEINRAVAQEPIDSTATVRDDAAEEDKPANVVPLERRGLPRQSE